MLEHSWVHRRVETIDILSTQFLRRTVSVDFTVPEPVREHLQNGDAAQWFVPLATLVKRPLRNFDLRDEAGKSLPVLGRDHNGPLAHAALAGVAARALHRAGLPDVSERLQAEFATVATADSPLATEAVARIVRAGEDGDEECRVVLNDPATVFLMADLAANYVLLGVCDDVSRRRVLKFSYEERLVVARPGVLERLGWRALVIELDAPGISRTASYHAEIAVPEELRFEATLLYDADSREVYADDGEADRAALHAAQIPLGARGRILFGLLAERTTFPVVGFAVAWTTALLLAGGAFLAELERAEAGPPISVLLAASAVFAGAVARAGEHRFVQALFAGPRLLLVASALSALAAAASLAYSADQDVLCAIWRSAAVVSVLVAITLTIGLVVARPISPGKHE